MSTFWLLAGLLLGTTGLDVLTTRAALMRCPTCQELNPLARPFVRSTPTLVVYVAVPTTMVLGVSAEAKRAQVASWWVPLVTLSALHLVFAVHNARLNP